MWVSPNDSPKTSFQLCKYYEKIWRVSPQRNNFVQVHPFRKPESAKDSSLELAAAGNAIASYW